MGHTIKDEAIKNASLEAARDVNPIDDIRSCDDYSWKMSEVLVGRAIKTALSRIK